MPLSGLPLAASLLATVGVTALVVVAIVAAVVSAFLFRRAQGQVGPAGTDAVSDMIRAQERIGDRIETLVSQQQLQAETQRQALAQSLDTIGQAVGEQRLQVDGLRNELRHEVRRRDAELEEIRSQLVSIQSAQGALGSGTPQRALPEATAPPVPSAPPPPAFTAPELPEPLPVTAPASEASPDPDPAERVPQADPSFTSAEPAVSADSWASLFQSGSFDSGDGAAPGPFEASAPAESAVTEPFPAEPTPSVPADVDPVPPGPDAVGPRAEEFIAFEPAAFDALIPHPPAEPAAFQPTDFDWATSPPTEPAAFEPAAFEPAAFEPAAFEPYSENDRDASSDFLSAELPSAPLAPSSFDAEPSAELPSFDPALIPMPASSGWSSVPPPPTDAAWVSRPEEPPTAPPTAPPPGADDLTVITGVDAGIQQLLYNQGVTTLDEIARWSRSDARAIATKVGVSEDTVVNQWIIEAQTALWQTHSSGRF